MIFIVGNSRSGTTLMGRILGANSDVYTFEELHFFEKMVSDEDVVSPKDLSHADQAALARRLLASARGNIFSSTKDAGLDPDVDAILAKSNGVSAVDIYRAFLAHETQRHGKSTPCEQTPRYLFSLGSVLHAFPDARVVVMVRDPRDILLSQKGKWRTYFHGSWDMPLHEALRVWANFHPILVTKMWASACRETRKWRNDPRVMVVKFESMIGNEETTVRALSDHCGIKFEPEMLKIDDVGSSITPDQQGAKGINPKAANRWRSVPMSQFERAAVATFCKRDMLDYGYEPIEVSWRRLSIALMIPSLCVKAALSLAFHLRNPRVTMEFIKKRFLK